MQAESSLAESRKRMILIYQNLNDKIKEKMIWKQRSGGRIMKNLKP